MNNEIKEIRDILFELQFLGNDTQSKVVKLYDYITNLQQENERLKEEKQRLLYNLEKVCEEDATTNN